MAQTRKNLVKGLELILKVSERCNINCSYCYYFNGNSSLYKESSPIIQDKVIRQLPNFIKKAVEDFNFEEVQIDFHGGEPTLLGVKKTRQICKLLTRELEDYCKLRFVIQTNATLINEEWCELFKEFSFGVGVSLDGSKKTNDLYRIDHKGCGTYDRTIRGLNLLQVNAKKNSLRPPTVLSVITPETNGKESFLHFVNDLNCKNIDFLLPDETHDTISTDTLYVGKVLSEVFDEWMVLDDPSISVRVLRSIISLMMGGPSYLVGFGSEPIFAYTISFDGKLYVDDTLRGCGDEFYDFGFNIFNHTLYNFVNSEKCRELDLINKKRHC